LGEFLSVFKVNKGSHILYYNVSVLSFYYYGLF
jgi:hypothetical protein